MYLPYSVYLRCYKAILSHLRVVTRTKCWIRCRFTWIKRYISRKCFVFGTQDEVNGGWSYSRITKALGTKNAQSNLRKTKTLTTSLSARWINFTKYFLSLGCGL